MIGLSVGGHVAYLAATELDLPTVVVAYGGWIPTADIPLSQPQPTITKTAGITSRVLVLVGDRDSLIPPEQRRQLTHALTGAGVTHELVEYPDTGHGFLCDRRHSYQASAAQDAWKRIEGLLASSKASSKSTSRPQRDYTDRLPAQNAESVVAVDRAT